MLGDLEFFDGMPSKARVKKTYVCVAGRQNVPLRYWQAMEWLGGVEEPEHA
ncbi:MAG: hypothetical protein NTU79_05235 [Planctomycetota bacterium]|nr:hypothetical protein [Planctomycetota bacterium]